jgi:hypothetical protein
LNPLNEVILKKKLSEADMTSLQKKCPMCAEEIPLAAVTCEYCSAQFIVTSSGYCQNCHQVREADGDGQCKVCGNAVIDLRVESKLIEEPEQKPLPISQAIAQAETPKTRKSRLPISVLVSILVFAIIGAFLWSRHNSLPTFPSFLATNTSTATATLTPPSTSTATPTHMPRPTPTATPVPTWVTEFSEPILATIANTSPHFEDDFSQVSDGWRIEKRDDRCRVKIQDGAFTMSVEAGRGMARCSNPGLRFNNFVLRVDTDFSKLGPRDSAQIGWNGITPYHDGLILSLLKEGNWSIDICGNNSCTNFASGWQPISPTRKVAITIISKDREYAIYMDETPVSHINDSEQQLGIVITLGMDVPSLSASPMIKYDNLKIWNLDYIPNLP